MTTQPLYLKQNVLVEPMVNQWYAWSGLIAPATAAMYIANSHVKIMQSFVAAPQVHVSALKNPAMRGGPFINCDASRAPEIKNLLRKTQDEQAHMLKLAEAIQKFNETLAGEANGFSLEPVYQKMPEELKGYVELVYDLNNHSSMRLIEGLLYKSPYYNTRTQSVALSLVEHDDRPFALSTPILADDGRIFLPLPFSSESLDELFKMKQTPQPLSFIKEVLQVRDEEAGLFSSFFTEEPPAPVRKYDGDGVRIRYFGHACVLIESKEVSVLTDPVVSYKHGNGIFRYTYEDLPETLDYVLITHNHQDHCMFETLLQLRHKIRNIIVPKNNGGGLADPSLKLVLQNIGFKQVRELDEMETVEVEGGYLMGLPFLGEHADLNIRSKMAYLTRLKGKSILCAADSNNIEPRLYQHIHEVTGDVDAVFVGMECDGGPLSWLYGPLMTKPLARKQDQSRRLDGSDFEKALNLIERLRPGHVYVYAMGQEPWLTYLTSIQYTDESRPITESNRLVTECRGRGLDSERLFGSKEILF
ncbi:MAG TPA: MBL fold metallo-hydrolase [Pyrinomonadaceae bacterium]|jgi:L-ascorbate metabolism protein UlaG (beta-lactamase superfamily)